LLALPAHNQVAWLLLIVYYLPQLAPETDTKSPADMPWQTKESFKVDYPWAKKLAIELGCRIAHADPTFLDGVQLVESVLIKTCAKLQAMERKPKKKVHDLEFHNACRSNL
jgi:hypothetical protein